VLGTCAEGLLVALLLTGCAHDAAQVRARALSIRRANPGKQAQYVPLHYRDGQNNSWARRRIRGT
jgi:hypothetical protein